MGGDRSEVSVVGLRVVLGARAALIPNNLSSARR